ncbi:MAG: Uma2 family endonuclease [Marinilabiliaceae bacterium]|nr:Uma2 family endonuclease [Marinilabiliaceae bacterium]
MELALDLNKRYSYADYLTWIDDIRRELIDGFINMMAGTSILHGKISKNITWYLESAIRKFKGNCELFYAPIDVLLPKNNETENDKIYNVVQPDIFVVCGEWKGDNNAYRGVPDMVVEIVSPSSRKKDTIKKFQLYQEAGVREYWIVDPKVNSITTYIMLENGEYNDGEVYQKNEKIPVHIFDGHLIETNDIFNF